MQKCSHCGQENEDGWASCVGCARPLAGSSPETPANQPARLLRFAAAYVALVALILVVASSFNSRTERFDGVQITGTKEFRAQVSAALELLRRRAAGAYAQVTNHVGLVAEAKRSGMAAERTPPTMFLAKPTAFYSLTWCAGSIAHDSIHSKFYHQYLQKFPQSSAVPENVYCGEAVEKLCSEHQLQVLREIGASEHELQSCIWNPSNRYWEIPYEKRNW